MNFQWSENQQSLHQRLTGFGSEKLSPGTSGRDATSTFDPDLWRAAAGEGVLGLFVPAEFGGAGHDIITTIYAMEGLGYGCRDNGLTLALNGQMWSIQAPLLSFGTDDQKHRFLPGLCSGDLLCAHGMTEPESGSDAFSLRTRATKTDGGYLLNGDKWLIGLGPVCDLALVFATLNPALGRWGVTAFLVHADAQGFEATPPEEKIGLRTGPTGRLKFRDVFVPERDRLGPEGGGVALFSHAILWERSFIFTSHVGSMARQLDDTTAFARKRVIAGVPIIEHQSVSNRLADMRLRLETSRLLLYKCACAHDTGDATPALSAMAKLQISESFVSNSIDAMRITGGRSCLTEFEIERDLRDAIGGVIYAGTSDIQRNIISQLGDL